MPGGTRLHDLTRFGLADMTDLSGRLRRVGTGARSMEEVAGRIVRELNGSLGDGQGRRAAVLTRFYKTHRYADLPAPLRQFARGTAKKDLESDVRCLTLLATAGTRPEWNDRSASQGHQAIPLLSEEMVQAAPMISRLIQQFGLPVATVVRPRAEVIVDLAARTYNVFHVPVAEASPHIPAQEFVREHGVRSALGFGGVLPSGNLFAIILFSRVPISAETADMFRSLALSVKVAVLPFDEFSVFEEVAV